MADHRPLRLVPLLGLLSALAAGCSTSAEFEGRDEAGLHATGRLTYEFDHEPADDDPIRAGRGLRWTAEAELTTTTGDIGSAEYDLTEITVGAQLALRDHDRSRVSLLLGGASTDASLDADGQAGFVEFDENNFGPYVGFDARYFTEGRYAIYGRAQNAWLFDDATSLRAEIGTEIHLGGPVDLLIGYRWWRYVFDEGDTFSSDADAEIRMRGLVAGLHVGL